jgi:hypothetical protein
MPKVEQYRQTLKNLPNWDDFLLQESGLPGPRANLELVQAVADEGDAALFHRYLALGPEEAPTNSPPVFLAVCGVVGLGRLLAEGQGDVLPLLRQAAGDPRWRIREAVCMALQRWGQADMAALIEEMGRWSRGSFLEQRAAAASLCEPALLRRPEQVERVLQILDEITTALTAVQNRRDDDFKVLRQGLAYCWSVAVVALPAVGQPLMEKWLASLDKDVRWIMKENLQKKRLARLDPDWVEQSKALLA